MGKWFYEMSAVRDKSGLHFSVRRLRSVRRTVAGSVGIDEVEIDKSYIHPCVYFERQDARDAAKNLNESRRENE